MTATIGYGIRQMEAIGHELEAVNGGLLPLSKVSVEVGALVSQLDRDHDRFARPGSANDAARKANATLYRKSIKDALARGVVTADRAQERVHQRVLAYGLDHPDQDPDDEGEGEGTEGQEEGVGENRPDPVPHGNEAGRGNTEVALEKGQKPPSVPNEEGIIQPEALPNRR